MPPVLVALLLFGVIACWSLGTPLGASPDEASHTVKAVAVAHGELFGDLGPVPVDRSLPGAMTTVRIPFSYDWVAKGNCYAFWPDQTASCQRPIPDGHNDEVVDATTAAGHYPPLYYLLVGLPSLVLPADIGVYAMRLMSAAITTLFYAWGLVALLSRGSRRMTLWSVAVALTPMCLFLSGTINPNGLEIATAFSVWSASLALFSGRSNASARSLWLQLGISAAVLVNIRALSPLWMLVAIGVSVLSADSAGLRAAWRSRWAVPVTGAIAVTTAIGLSWTMRYGTLLTGKNLWPEYNDRLMAIRDIIASTSPQYLQMIGNLGWLDTPSPPLTVVSWTVALISLTALALAAARMRRAKLALVVLLLGVFFGPMILELPAAADAGLVWQGRYTLPIAIGVPLLAGVIVGHRRAGLNPVLLLPARMMVPLLGLANVAAFYATMRRYSVGATGELGIGQLDWSSPIGYLSAVGIYAVLVAVLCALALRSTRRLRPPAVRAEPVPPAADAGRLAANPSGSDYQVRAWSTQVHKR